MCVSSFFISHNHYFLPHLSFKEIYTSVIHILYSTHQNLHVTHITLKLLSDANSMPRSKRLSSGIWSEQRASSGVLNGKNLSAKKQTICDLKSSMQKKTNHMMILQNVVMCNNRTFIQLISINMFSKLDQHMTDKQTDCGLALAFTHRTSNIKSTKNQKAQIKAQIFHIMKC